MATPFVGQISMFGGDFAPLSYALCEGQTISISQNPTLFALLGTQYGGNGESTFQLPNLQGRVPIHQGLLPSGSIYTVGEMLGTEDVTLTIPQIPIHTHTAQVSLNGTTDSPVGAYPATDPAGNVAQFYNGAPANAQMNNAAIGQTGNGLPHTNIQPFLAITFIIALVGVFPTRS